MVPTLSYLGPCCTVTSHTDFGMENKLLSIPEAQDSWRCRGGYCFLLLSSQDFPFCPVMERLLQSQEKKQILVWNHQNLCLSLRCDPPAHGVLLRRDTKPCGTRVSIHIPSVVWTALDSHCLQTSPPPSNLPWCFQQPQVTLSSFIATAKANFKRPKPLCLEGTMLFYLVLWVKQGPPSCVKELNVTLNYGRH